MSIYTPSTFDEYENAIGVVFTRPDHNSPNIHEFSLILTNLKRPIKHGQYCVVESPEGLIVGLIEQIFINNQYFQDVQTVKSFDLAQINLQNFFPSDQWECHIADVSVCGVIPCQKCYGNAINQPTLFRKIDRIGFPVKPGNKCYLLEGECLRNFLGITESGLHIGLLKHHDLEANMNLNRLFNKHLAILAQSGAGKSYLISVLLEELLLRDNDAGTPAMILVDVHGEYRYLSEINDQDGISKKIHLINASFLQIGVPNLSEYDFQRYQPGISIAQMRELRKIIRSCRQKMNQEKNIKNIEKTRFNENNYAHGYDIQDIINELKSDEEINPKVGETLLNWLYDLDHLHIFGKRDMPQLSELVRLGDLTILDLSTIISMRKKQILLQYFSNRMFEARRANLIPPFILFLEEAHNFLPESNSNSAIAKYILETIAREGRKFYAQLVLVSQRPVHLSTTALSQCNSQIILRVTNPYDLDHIKATSEALTKNAIKMVSTLPTGNALIMGAALNYPIFIQIRARNFKNEASEKTLEDVCVEFEKKEKFIKVEKNALRLTSTDVFESIILK